MAALMLCGATCNLNGTSQTGQTSPSTQASPSENASSTAPPTPATIAGFPLPGGEVALAYSAAFSANGGTTPYAWSIIAGALPGGLNLGQDGSVSGTPTTPGTFTFSVQVTDKNNASSNASGSIKVYPRLAASLISACASACSVEQGCVNVCGNFGTQSGGAAPYRYSAAGNIPKGESLDGLSLAGSFPSLAQFWQFNVTVTDAMGATATITPTFYVYRHISLASTSALCTQSSAQCVIRVGYSGGSPGGTPKLTVGAFSPATGPPKGYSATATGGVLTFQANGQNWSGTVTLTLTDQSLCGPGSARCSASVLITIKL
jgi:hypothetical protein